MILKKKTIEERFNKMLKKKSITITVEDTMKHLNIDRDKALDINEQRDRWMVVLKQNPGLNKSEYKKIGKGLYTWIYRNDNEWFEEITPINIKYKYEKHKK